ncbi:MAG: DUF2244 domain-containing protein [Candidatus Heimdallarchaeota archaeon]|nr:DUF2244 domain-containing protein [Candidatus Heimdallarchaeota archaeon]
MSKNNSRQILIMIIVTTVASIAIGIVVWILGPDDFWFVFAAIGAGLIFAVGPLIFKYNRAKKEDASRPADQPYRSYAPESNIYQPVKEPQTPETYTPETTQTPAFCTYCGVSAKPGHTYCDNCGKALGK